jgi:tetratricopeptide (TPR) repeat protein
MLEETLTSAREFRFARLEASALVGLAELAGEQGDFARVETYLQEARVKYRELGPGLHGLTLAYGLHAFGYLVLRQGDVARARGLFDEAVTLARDSAGPTASAEFLHSLGDALRAGGDFRGAAQKYRDGLILAQEANLLSVAGNCLSGLAALASAVGRDETAARLNGAVASLRETVSTQQTRAAEGNVAGKTAVQTALGLAFAVEGSAGSNAVPLDVAVREALSFVEDVAFLPSPDGPHDAAETA